MITADEARQKAAKISDSSLVTELATIGILIEDAISRGQMAIYPDFNISEGAKGRLKLLGYLVSYPQTGHNSYDTKISW